MRKTKNTSSKKAGKNSFTNNVSDYKYEPQVETPNPKAASNNTFDHPSR